MKYQISNPKSQTVGILFFLRALSFGLGPLIFCFVLLPLIFFPLMGGLRGADIDSLILLLKTQPDDSNKVLALNQLFLLHEFRDVTKAKDYIRLAYELSRKIDYKKGTAICCNHYGYLAEDTGNYAQAIVNYQRALEIFDKIPYKMGVAVAHNNLGSVYYRQGRYETAMENYLKTLQIKEETGDKKGAATAYINIGLIYWNQERFELAMDNYGKAMALFTEIADKRGLGYVYNNIGIIYFEMAKRELTDKNRKKQLFENAEDNYRKSLQIRIELADNKGIAAAYNNLGEVYYRQSQTAPDTKLSNQLIGEALENFLKSLKLREEISDKSGMASSHGNIGLVYLEQKNLKLAEEFLTRSLMISRELGTREYENSAYNGLAGVHEAAGDYKKSLEYYKLYKKLSDSLLNKANFKKIAQMQAAFDAEKKDAQINLLNARNEKQMAENKKQQLLILLIVAVAVAVAVVAGIILRTLLVTRRQKRIIEKSKNIIEKQKEVIEEKNRNITDSIEYAQRIQEAILPPTEEIDKILDEYFIFHRQKDIIGGDFYFISPLMGGQGGAIIALADCTGHGVPGALMSMLGKDMLSDIVNDRHITLAGQVLDMLNNRVTDALNPDKAAEVKISDGMDIGFIAMQGDELQFAGARRPLIVCCDGTLDRYDGDNRSIGGEREAAHTFQTHKLKLEKGMMIYLFTDGFADQMGGSPPQSPQRGEERTSFYGKKFTSKRLKELLLKTALKPISEQKEVLEKTFEEWKGTSEQTDDVTVIGIRV